jgi:hypothetical protein
MAIEQARREEEEAEKREAEGELLPPPLFPSALVTHTTTELNALKAKVRGEAPAASSVRPLVPRLSQAKLTCPSVTY